MGYIVTESYLHHFYFRATLEWRKYCTIKKLDLEIFMDSDSISFPSYKKHCRKSVCVCVCMCVCVCVHTCAWSVQGVCEWVCVCVCVCVCVFVYQQQIKILKNKKKVFLVYGLRNGSHRQTHTHSSDEHIPALLTSRQRSFKIWPISWQTSMAPCLKYYWLYVQKWGNFEPLYLGNESAFRKIKKCFSFRVLGMYHKISNNCHE